MFKLKKRRKNDGVYMITLGTETGCTIGVSKAAHVWSYNPSLEGHLLLSLRMQDPDDDRFAEVLLDPVAAHKLQYAISALGEDKP